MIEMTFWVIAGLVALSFVAEFIDSSLGMLYGTLLSPLLISFGFDPLLIVPALLFSQAIGGFTASMFHQKFNNADFRPRKIEKNENEKEHLGLRKWIKNKFRKDFKIVILVSALGVVTTIFSAMIAVNISKEALKLYIAILVLVMGAILLTRMKFRFSWKKMLGVGLISSFNKGLSGGGFGPVVTSSQVVLGNNPKSSIATTTFAEAPICITGFITYYLLKGGFSDWNFILALSLGAAAAAPLGALLTSRFNEVKIRPYLGILTVGVGMYMIYKLYWG